MKHFARMELRGGRCVLVCLNRGRRGERGERGKKRFPRMKHFARMELIPNSFDSLSSHTLRWSGRVERDELC